MDIDVFGGMFSIIPSLSRPLGLPKNKDILVIDGRVFSPILCLQRAIGGSSGYTRDDRGHIISDKGYVLRTSTGYFYSRRAVEMELATRGKAWRLPTEADIKLMIEEYNEKIENKELGIWTSIKDIVPGRATLQGAYTIASMSSMEPKVMQVEHSARAIYKMEGKDRYYLFYRGGYRDSIMTQELQEDIVTLTQVRLLKNINYTRLR